MPSTAWISLVESSNKEPPHPHPAMNISSSAADASEFLKHGISSAEIPVSSAATVSANENVKLERGDALGTKSIIASGCASDSNTDNCTALDRKPMKNTSRERMKAETTFLRTRVQELERELSQTLAKKALERCTMPSPVWRDLAKRHAARREKSEQERDRLRARLLHQLQVAKSLETIFRNRAGAFIDDLCASAATSPHQAYPVENLAMLHDLFMDQIDKMYPLVDTIFAEPVAPHDAMEMPVRRSTVVSQPVNGDERLYVELRNVVYVPFAFDRVCSALWRVITTEYSRQQRLVEQYRCTDDEYSCTFFSHKNTPSIGHHSLASIVMRKFTEANRTVVVWRSVSWDQLPSVNREYGDETGWIVVTPLVDSSTGEPTSEGAIVRVCDRYIPVLEVQAQLIAAGVLEVESASLSDETSSEQSLQVGEFTNRILNGTEEDIAAMTESIENILLDESIGSADDDLESIIQDLGVAHGQSDVVPDPAVLEWNL